MSGRSPKRAESLRTRFHMPTFLRSVLDDLKDSLEVAYPVLIEQVSSPSGFRNTIKRLLTEADLSMVSTHHYAALRQVDACVSKLNSWGSASESDRQAKALEKFLHAEKRCAIANRRLAFYSKHPKRIRPLVRQVLNQAIDSLWCALGALPDDETLFGESRFGPGLTYALRGQDQRNLMYKIDGDQTVTPECRALAGNTLFGVFPNWAQHLVERQFCLERVAGNRVAYVPKTADIDRTIGIEPSLNVFLQKGVDVYMRDRLRTYMGLRLDDQQWSIDCMRRNGLGISTIDLSAASDSVSIELVKMMLPPEWFALLDALRSRSFTLDDGLSFRPYHKFSSMGNATTFPLESAIFMAVAKACCSVAGYSDAVLDCVRVYGDDIIVPWQCAGLVIEVLSFLGFRTNSDKTFVFGPFRETCGIDLLNGVDVRPVFLRTIPTQPWTVAGLFNRLLTNRFGFTFHRTLPYLYNLVEFPLWGPAYYGWTSTSENWHEWYAGRNEMGDSYFFAPHPHHRPVAVTRLQHTEMYVCSERWQVVRLKSKADWPEGACYLAFLLGLESGRPQGNMIVKRVESVSTAPYPQLDWFPAVYTAPREPSDRLLRRITRAVIGK